MTSQKWRRKNFLIVLKTLYESVVSPSATAFSWNRCLQLDNHLGLSLAAAASQEDVLYLHTLSGDEQTKVTAGGEFDKEERIESFSECFHIFCRCLSRILKRESSSVEVNRQSDELSSRVYRPRVNENGFFIEVFDATHDAAK
jgi:hypothetical protein